MRLYEYAEDFARLFDDLDAIADYVPDQNEDGQYIDADGNVIDDLATYKSDMQTAWFDTLDGMEQEFEEKAESIAAYIKSLKADAEDLKAEETALQRRRKVKENQAESLKRYLLEAMQTIGRQRIDRPRARVSVKNNPESVSFRDEAAFVATCQASPGMENFLRFKAPEINRTAVKKSLQAGTQIEGAELVRTQSLIIS